MSRDAVWRRVGLESVGEEEWKIKFQFSDGHGNQEAVEVNFPSKAAAWGGETAALTQLAERLGGKVEGLTVRVPRQRSFI